MASTKFGVIYSTGNAIIRRHIYPNSDSELTLALCAAGEGIALVSRGPYPNSAAWQAAINNAVLAATGKPPGNSTCCVVDQTNKVVQLIAADASIDSLPNMTLVQAYATIPVGSTYDSATGLFTAPGYTIAAYPGNGSDRPATNAVAVLPAVIAKP